MLLLLQLTLLIDLLRLLVLKLTLLLQLLRALLHQLVLLFLLCLQPRLLLLVRLPLLFLLCLALLLRLRVRLLPCLPLLRLHINWRRHWRGRRCRSRYCGLCRRRSRARFTRRATCFNCCRCGGYYR